MMSSLGVDISVKHAELKFSSYFQRNYLHGSLQIMTKKLTGVGEKEGVFNAPLTPLSTNKELKEAIFNDIHNFNVFTFNGK